MEKKFLPIDIEKATKSDADARFVLSAPTLDRVNDRIDPKAYEPYVGEKIIALWQHNNSQPIGAWKDLFIRGKKLVGDLKITNTRLGEMIRALLSDDVPLGASIGFSGEGEYNDKGGIDYTKINLFEVSLVSVPAHPLAVQISKQLGVDPSTLVDPASVPATSRQQMEHTVKKAKIAILEANKTLRRKK